MTGIGAEPWHFRYVGVPHAGYGAVGMTLEEYVNFLRKREGSRIICRTGGRQYEIPIGNARLAEWKLSCLRTGRFKCPAIMWTGV